MILDVISDQKILAIFFTLQLPLTFLMKILPIYAANSINLSMGVFLIHFFVSSVKLKLVYLCVVLANYFLIKISNSLKKIELLWFMLAFNCGIYSFVYLYEADFKFDQYVYGLPVVMNFFVLRVTHLAFLLHDNEEMAKDFNFFDYIHYTLGFLTILSGPFIDYLNYKKIFKDGDTKISKNSPKIKTILISLATVLCLVPIFNPKSIFAQNSIIKTLDYYTFFLNTINSRIFLLCMHLYTILCIVLLGYDMSLFLGSPTTEENERQLSRTYSYSVRSCFVRSTLREDVSQWNLAVVMWLNQLFRGRVSNKNLPVFVLMMSALWHGPTVGYVGGALIVITALNINKQWYKLRTTKKKLRFAEILIETKICNFFSWMLTAITVFAIVVMLTDQNIDTITSKYARVYFWPLWGIPLTSLGLSALNKILI